MLIAVNRALHIRLLLCTCWLLAVAGTIDAQKLEITPAEVMADEVATIRVTGLQPHARVALQAQLVDGSGQSWASRAEFEADANGTIDLATQAPVKGSYKTVSAMGLIWSMTPASKNVALYQTPHGDGIQAIDFSLMDGDKQEASAELRPMFRPDNVRRVDLTGALHGAMFLPNTPGPHPGVLVLGGSEGGMPQGTAQWLASHGYAAVALAYFRYKELPAALEAIPLEYFGQAIQWMMHQPEISPDRLAVVGGSRGGELALQLGSMYPQLHAVVAYVPANVRFPSCCSHALTAAWTWRGRDLPFALPRQAGMLDVMAAAIPVENTHGPILVISGDDDGVWPSWQMTAAIQQRLRGAHFGYSFERLNYPHAGHRAGHPEIVPAWLGNVKQPVSGEAMNLGGTPQGNALSSLDAIPKVLEFLHAALGADAAAGAEASKTTGPQ
jgi:dienelactone hydrolase